MSEDRLHGFLEDFGAREDAPWLVTYADMMTLLLVFFVLLYTVFYVEQGRLHGELVKRIDQQDLAHQPNELFEGHGPLVLEQVTGLQVIEGALVEDLQQGIAHAAPDYQVMAQGDKIVIAVSGKLLFSSGQAQLRNAGTQVFDQLVPIFLRYPDYTINIKGHTDDRPIATSRYSSNWELSAIRATTVLRYMLERGVPAQRMTATGYGDVLPLYTNDSTENRSRNRRVEFVLEKF